MQKYRRKSITVFWALLMALGIIFCFAVFGLAAENTPKQNDTKETATSLSLNTVYYDNLMSNSDIDWYQFRTSSNGYIQLDFTHDVLTSGNNYWLVQLYNSDMDELAIFRVTGTGAKASSAVLGVPVGTYFIKIDNSSYTLTQQL